jgi:tRNA threonylcarbamoyladenosine biosynthesis protein TsaE
MKKYWTSTSPEQTLTLGRKIGQGLAGEAGLIYLTGDLGAGKTKLTQGIVEGLGIEAEVTSPTFALIHEYGPEGEVIHADLYRLESYEELQEIGFEEYLDEDHLILCEWPDLLEEEGLEPIFRLDLRRVDGESEQARRIALTADDGALGERMAAIEI